MTRSEGNPDVQNILDQLRDQLGVGNVMLTRTEPGHAFVFAVSKRNHETFRPKGMDRDQSICAYVQEMAFPLIIDDAASHPLVKDSALVRTNKVGAYIGYPVRDDRGGVVAVLCAISSRLRRWTSQELRATEAAAALVADLIQPRVLAESRPIN